MAIAPKKEIHTRGALKYHVPSSAYHHQNLRILLLFAATHNHRRLLSMMKTHSWNSLSTKTRSPLKAKGGPLIHKHFTEVSSISYSIKGISLCRLIGGFNCEEGQEDENVVRPCPYPYPSPRSCPCSHSYHVLACQSYSVVHLPVATVKS